MQGLLLRETRKHKNDGPILKTGTLSLGLFGSYDGKQDIIMRWNKALHNQNVMTKL